VRSAHGRWVTAHRAVYLTGGVTADDGTLHVTADQADYHETTDRIVLAGNVHITDRNLVATSQFGSYDVRERAGELWGSVEAVERGRRLRAQEFRYDRDTGLAEARGDVWAADSSGNTVLTAGTLIYDKETQFATAYEGPRLTRLEEGREVVLTADTLHLRQAEKVAWAVGGVRIVRDTLSATAERITYWDEDERSLLLGKPRVWNREIEASGDTIEVFARRKELERAVVEGAAQIAFVSQGLGTEGERNLLSAPRVEIFFAEERAESLQAVGGATNRYEGVPRPGRLAERNQVEGDTISVYFGHDQMERAVVTGSPEGVFRFELAAAESLAAEQETVNYEGERVEYHAPDRRIEIDGAARVRYQGTDLSAGRITFDARREELVAREAPILKTPDSEDLSGRTMTYDLTTRTGTVYQARTHYDDGFYSGQAIHDAGNNTLLVRGAEYTTCDLEEPHYHLYANQMKIQLRDKLVARPIVFYVKDMPILALPFYVLPINRERHSGILFPQIQFGFSSQQGRFIRNLGYFWAVNDYLDFTLSGDWYAQEPAWVGRFETRYLSTGRLEGYLNARFLRSDALYSTEQWELRGSHNQVLSPSTRLAAQADFTSSADFTKDPITGEPLANRKDRFLTSSVNLNHRRSWGLFNFTVSQRQDLDTDPVSSPLPSLTLDLPSVSFSFPQRALGRAATADRAGFLPFLSSLYLSYSLKGVNRLEEQKLASGGDTTVTEFVSQSTISLTDNRRLPGGLTLSPRFGSTQALYEHDALGQAWQPAAVYNLGVGLSGTYYGTFRPRLGALYGLRHVVFPQLLYSWQPSFESLTYVDSTGAEQNRFPSYAGVGISGFRQSFLTYGLQQRFQARLRFGEKTVDLPNFLTWTTGGSYNFLYEEAGVPTPWRPVTNSFLLQPPGIFNFDLSTTHNFDAKPYWKNITYSLGLRLDGTGKTPSPIAEIPLQGNEALTRGDALTQAPWSMNFTYSYTAGRNASGGWDRNRLGNFVLSFNPTAKWHLDYYNSINFNEGEITAQEFAVVRDLHCWQARFVRRFTADGESEFYFRIHLRNRSDIYLEQGTRGLGSFLQY
jgi:lipopolysaccharide assembly outer membrane protein LptD (OstA)